MQVHAKSRSVVGSVRQAIATLLPNGPPAINSTARFLGVHTRTLQRRLADSGTTYSQIVGAVRRDTAMHLLEDDRVPLGHIANLLGYSDASHFTRAFIRWTGMTPTDYRLRGREEHPTYRKIGQGKRGER